MAKSAKFSLKLLIDEEKNKVVLAEAGQDFVDVLFSLLTLPMGTIAKLLEKHQKLPQVLGCYEKLNKSVTNLGIENFETEACKNGVFVSCRSSFIVTDDLKVTLNSIGAIVNVLKDLGYQCFSDMREMVIEVGFEEVVVLLGCLFTTNAPFTYAFLKKDNFPWTETTLLSPLVQESKPSKVFHVKVFVRKLDRKILYAESGEDFVDSLLTFLVLPLELAWSLSSYNTILECVRNLRTSKCRRAMDSNLFELPGYYACKNRLLDIQPSPFLTFQCLIPKDYSYDSVLKFTKRVESCYFIPQDILNVYPNDPKYKSGTMTPSDGFLRRGTKFIVSDDLFITTMSSSSTIGLLKKNEVDISDIEEHAISISKAEFISVLRASLISSSALTNGLSSLLVKKPKEET
ncbi:unnamed protein product [Arabis nemorensis]|uniref:DUF674 domain-containing protein n=1 Tax=Arabis nemorensis TaxID=586526 RepID=A0A565B5L0_9BRAS|nr:unnamed protein product [Arabis nemorensis]